MERIVIFSSEKDLAKKFRCAIGNDAWNNFGFNSDNKWMLFCDGYMISNVPEAFNLLLVCEPDNIPEDFDFTSYQDILKNIARAFHSFIDNDDKLYVLCHKHTGSKCKSIQQEFIRGLPGHYTFVGEYSHSENDDRYLAVADVMEAGENPNIRRDYQPRVGKLLATLSFPALYDQAAEIQMQLFLKYCQAQSETHGANPVDLGDLPKSYQEFAKAARIQNPGLDKEDIPESLLALCNDNWEQKSIREDMDKFGQHMNKILLSVSRVY